MKKLFILFNLYILMIPQIALPATVDRCVKLNPSHGCTGGSESEAVAWEVRCSSGEVPVQGISVCSSTYGGGTGETSEELEVSYNIENNIYCWCKMLSPAVSNFTYSYDLSNTTAEGCANECAAACAYMTTSDSYFRSALFSNLTE